ncbi:polysaccharide biosynthesis protein, partial [Candidatus Pelagibacter sp.]|nr:polysaccharide biosynthesis protein [Candidatus Pelagibacter sp.]
MRKKLLITGGTGSFGNAVLKRYVKNNKISKIFILSRDEAKQHYMKQLYKSDKIEYIIADVRDYQSLIDKIVNVDLVFHAAALKHVPSNEFNPNEAIKTNILGTNNVINVCRLNNIKKLILLSTDKAVYPINTMGMTKAIAEKLILENYKNTKTSISIVRYGNVLNSRGSVVETFVKQLLDKNCKSLTITDEKMTRFLLPLDDAVSLVETAEKSRNYGEIFIKKSPAAKIIDLAKACMELLNIKKKIKFIGIRAGEKLHETLISYEESLHTKKNKSHFVIKFNKNLQDSDFFMKGNKKKRMFKYSSN